MTGRQKAVVGAVGVLVLASLVATGVLRNRRKRVDVRLETVGRRDLVATVTASGNIRAHRSVDISSDIMGRVVQLPVEEGDTVQAGDVLIRLDPSQYRASVARARATLSQAQAQVAQQSANVLSSKREDDRVRSLWSRDSTLVSRQQLDDAETALQVAQAQLTAAKHGVEEARAALSEAEDQLSKTVIRAPISGQVTRLNIDEGETAVVGTMNNPGSLLLTISDLSRVEALLEVDETDVPQLALGDSAVVEIDAFPDRRFSGTVTRIGSSAVHPPSTTTSGAQASAVNFEVVVTLKKPPVTLRPDLSATADIVTAVRRNVLAVPIISLTVREKGHENEAAPDSQADEGSIGPQGGVEGPLRSATRPEVEGVFVVRDGRAHFTPVRVGIAGQEYFEVLSGVAQGDTVVAGPYSRIRGLADGDAVRAMKQEEASR